jgi:hypothetical protein
LAAALLVALGRAPQEAIEEVRRVRPGTLETPSQEVFVHAVHARQPERGGQKPAPTLAPTPAPTQPPRPHPSPGAMPATGAEAPRLRVAFLLVPRFTLTAFAGFVDALRLAADEGDRSRPRLIQWAVLGDEPVASSCGTAVVPSAPLRDAQAWDCVVVVGGLLHGGQPVAPPALRFLREAAAHGRRLVGLCTGSFVLARAG